MNRKPVKTAPALLAIIAGKAPYLVFFEMTPSILGDMSRPDKIKVFQKSFIVAMPIFGIFVKNFISY